MAVTNEELHQLITAIKPAIKQVVDESISAAALPLIEGIHNQMEDMERNLESQIQENSRKIHYNSKKIDELRKDLQQQINDQTFMQQSQHEESLQVIGQKTQEKVSSEKHHHLETRVVRIEEHLGMAA
jgi:hypothetical protein